jgi:hypothetical protein
MLLTVLSSQLGSGAGAVPRSSALESRPIEPAQFEYATPEFERFASRKRVVK